jgi:hypothetical protein
VNLPFLLFPVVQEVAFDPSPPFSVLVGSTLELVPTVIGSNQVPLIGTASADLLWSSSDETVLAVGVETEQLVLTGVSPGTAELRAVRQDNSIISVPDTGVEGVPQTVTVT